MVLYVDYISIKREKKHRKADPNAEGIIADNCIIQEESDIHGTSCILHRP